MKIAGVAFAVVVVLCCVTVEVTSKKYKGLVEIGTWTHTKDGKSVAAGGPQGRSMGSGGQITTRFLISTSKASWEEATVMCPQITDNDAHLVRIETEDEDREVHNYIRSAGVRKVGELIWTDGVGNEGAKWAWNSNGEMITYTHFRAGPTGPNGYIAFRSTSNTPKGYEWVAKYDPSENYYYLCEIEEKEAGSVKRAETEAEDAPVAESEVMNLNPKRGTTYMPKRQG